MSVNFAPDELINVAIDIERRGISFYDVMAISTDDESARAVFQGLVDMEREHIEIFQDMLGEFDKHPSSEPISQEYADYLKSLIDTAVFTDDMITGEMATQADTDIKALELGISAEKDSILFYCEMRDIMPQRVLPALNRIINEEKTHLQQLTVTKKRLEEGNSEG